MEQWCEGAINRPGPAWKQGYDGLGNSRRDTGAVVHSAEGSLSAAFSVLDGARRSSWHFTTAKDGSFYQHYPLQAVPWHAGFEANIAYVGIECEGVAGEALTAPQFNALVRVLKWVREQEQWGAVARGETLFEHNEFMATACPSGRIPWDALIEAVMDVSGPQEIDLYRGLAAAAVNIREGWPLADLRAEDKRALRHITDQLGN
jgi:N-acetyl-anhydromuramyl-L-alanine amidase AmpD